MSSVNVVVSLAGKAFPPMRVNISSGAHGTVGRANITTGRVALEVAKIDIFQITSSAPGGVEVLVTATVGGQEKRIFGGEFVSSIVEYDQDVVMIEARDYAGVLVDQRRLPAGAATTAEQLLAPLAPGQNPSALPISTQNQKISQVVTGIAQEFGLTSVLNLDPANDPPVGSLFGDSDLVWMAIPQTLWGLLNQLARDTGYDVYVTPERQLVFGLPGVGTTPVQLNYNAAPLPAGALPCAHLRIRHNARRNSTFRVLVMSYDAGAGALTLGRADAIGTNLAKIAGLQAGIWSGQQAVAIDTKLAQLNSAAGGVGSYSQLYTYSAGRNYIPLYTFHVDGLTQAQADSRALAIATDIAKKEVSLTATVDSYLAATPTQTLTITGNIDSDFLQRNYYVYAYEHMYTLPGAQGGQGLDSGFTTTLHAVNVPVFGEGSATENPTGG